MREGKEINLQNGCVLYNADVTYFSTCYIFLRISLICIGIFVLTALVKEYLLLLGDKRNVSIS